MVSTVIEKTLEFDIASVSDEVLYAAVRRRPAFLAHFSEDEIVAEALNRDDKLGYEADFKDDNDLFAEDVVPADIRQLADLIAEGSTRDALDLLHRISPKEAPWPNTAMHVVACRAAAEPKLL